MHRDRTPWVLFVVIAGALLWSILGLGISLDRLGSLPSEVVRLLGLMLPPDVAYGQEKVLPAIIESLQVAWIGTLVGALLSLPLGLLGARTLFPAMPTFIKPVLAAIRAVPEVLLAIYFVPIVGLGAFAGVLAIGVHSVGTLGRLTTDVVESMDTGPLEAIRASGGGQLAVLRWGVLPQALPEILALWLYRFEINLRASAVLGVVGAGGIGGVLLNNLRYRRFDQVGAVLIATVIVVFAVDALSGAIRRRLVRE
jgi:phosphonate transport system permease protein